MQKNIEELAKSGMQFVLGPRPGKKSFNTLNELNLTHCCTLLSQREDAQAIEKICNKLKCQWVWLPVEGGRLEILRETDMAGHVRTLTDAISGDPAPRVYFHCSAGIHRTGFFTFLLLRSMGMDHTQALAELARLRPVTAEQVGEDRISLANQTAEEFLHSN